jgi:hypothetical protein
MLLLVAALGGGAGLAPLDRRQSLRLITIYAVLPRCQKASSAVESDLAGMRRCW